MSKPKSGKKVIVTGQKSEPKPTESKLKNLGTRSSGGTAGDDLIFSNNNFIWMAGGFVLVLVGILLMTGGKMPSPDVWDDSIIYSKRITVLGPIVIMAGLIVEVYAIFKK